MLEWRFGLLRSAGCAAALSALTVVALVSTPGLAQSGTVLELVEVRPSPAPSGVTVADGAVTLVGSSYQGQMTWSSPPAQITTSGFTLTMTASATASAGNYYAETSIHIGSEFEVEPPDRLQVGAFANAGESKSDSLTLTIKPKPGYLSAGSLVTINIGASFVAGVDYIYRAVDPGRGDGEDASSEDVGQDDGPDGRRLAAFLDCPPSIVISELPSLNCHIFITSWRNSADPVEVILPDALDTYGNHQNGIQLLQAQGSQDVFNWTAPYLWGMFVFACPAQQGTNASCFGSVTTPGPQSVAIIVRQGSDEVPLTLAINAVPGPNATACGFALGPEILAKWNQSGGRNGVLGCATGDEVQVATSPGGTQASQATFEGGLIVLHGEGPFSGAAFAVQGCIVGRYVGLGGTGSWLGLPVSDEYEIPGGRRADFEAGYIAWDRLTGGCIAMRDGSATFNVEPDTDRPGIDYRNFEAIGDRMEICRDTCAAEGSCVAYTYVRPGLQGPRAICWLKSGVPEALSSDCCTSGVKR